MVKFEYKVIPYKQHRYPTVGDYWEDKQGAHFRVSKMSNMRYEFLVLVHELIEYLLVKDRGIKIKDIDDFDIAFEKMRKAGLIDKKSEPGDDTLSPYFMEHQFATSIEMQLAEQLKVDWDKYIEEVINL